MYRSTVQVCGNESSQAALMVTISGVRGIAGVSLVPEVVTKYVAAFGTLLRSNNAEHPVVVVGRDSRITGPWVQSIANGVLTALGFDVLDLGIVPTPTVQFMVQQCKAVGGLVITSSHNPVMWNGLKFIDADGLFFSPERCESLFKVADEGCFTYSAYNRFGRVVPDLTANQRHVDFLLGLPYINVGLIRSKKFKVCLDTVNGAGGPILKLLLTALGCEIVGDLHTDPTGLFSHEPEPVPANLEELCAEVPRRHADFGMAADPDVDRLVLIDESGKAIGEEYTLALAVKFILQYTGKRGSICKNLSSSRAVDDVAAAFDGCPVYATPVGEIHVAKKMLSKKAVIGGEGNGGVMLPDCHIGRDAPVAAVLTLQHLAQSGLSLSALKASLPQWEIVKLKAPIAGIDPDAVVAHFKQAWSGRAGIQINAKDGLRIDAADWWVHLRKSNTEPIIRVIGEAKTANEAQQKCEEFMNEIVAFSRARAS
eukprot:gnl/Hemi2/7492_TR2571_c0_g1_i1.p1 gnl/Hemi2/7492_TR2571_c0_g1~~gnl/Hemi2/7492_TR2571_c0_g1_i1.p1  ORF type:complete len:482 (-),score=127.89 gnl/Hemi2/7492_TR2571_c0_g1_i1:74-1519(-)